MLGIFLYAGRAIMPLLLMMALGCGLRRVGRWSDDFYRQLNGFCFHVLLPVQLFLNVYAIEDLSVLNWRLLGFIVVCILGAAGLGVAAAPLFARDRGQRAVIAQATFRANQVIMGIPLASALGGQEALIFASLVTSVCVPVFNVLAVVVLTAYSSEKHLSWRDEVRRIFQNPLILGALAGFAAVLLRQLAPSVFDLPQTLPSVYKVCGDLSRAASPLVLVILGARLRFDAVQGLWKKITAAVAMRLVVVPGIVLTLAVLLRDPLGHHGGGNAHGGGHLLLAGGGDQRGDGPGDGRRRAAGPAGGGLELGPVHGHHLLLRRRPAGHGRDVRTEPFFSRRHRMGEKEGITWIRRTGMPWITKAAAGYGGGCRRSWTRIRRRRRRRTARRPRPRI